MMTPPEKITYRLTIEAALRAGHTISDKRNVMTVRPKAEWSTLTNPTVLFYAYDRIDQAQQIYRPQPNDVIEVAADFWCEMADIFQSYDDTVFHFDDDPSSTGITWDHLKRKDPLLRVVVGLDSFQSFIRSEELKVAEAASKEPPHEQ